MCSENKSGLPLVISFVHPSKLGLRDHSQALVHYGKRFDDDRRYYALVSLGALCKLLLRNRSSDSMIVVWDNSIRSLIALSFARLTGIVGIYYLHEPGGLGQKLFKSDPIIYTLVASFFETLMAKVSSKVFVPRPDKIAFGDYHAPLLFSEEREAPRSDRKMIGFMGARRKHRLYPLFQRITKDLEEAGFDIGYFPSEEHGSSENDKYHFLSKCLAVWNCYGVPYNQSGVTGDCLMSLTPVIISPFEPYKLLLEEMNLAVSMFLDEDQKTFSATLVNKLQSLHESIEYREQPTEISCQCSSFGGAVAFKRHWLEAFSAFSI